MEIIKKDLTTCTSGLIIHGCNTLGFFNAGVAKAIRTKWPIVYELYYEYVKTNKPKLGDVQFIELNHQLHIGNIFTQSSIGRTGIHANPDAIQTGLIKSFAYCQQNDIKDIYSSMIGCNLGGLKWENKKTAV